REVSAAPPAPPPVPPPVEPGRAGAPAPDPQSPSGRKGRGARDAGASPAAAPAAAAAPAGGSSSLLAVVEAAWPRLLARLREARQPKTAAFLIEGRPVSVQPDGVLLVEFPPERRFHRDSFERGKHRTYVEKAIVEVLGRPLRVDRKSTRLNSSHVKK